MNFIQKYKTNWWVVIADIFCICANVIFVFTFFPLTTKTPYVKYSIPILIYLVSWISISFLFGRYNSKRKTTFFIEIFRVFYTILLLYIAFALYILIEPHSAWSENILTLVSVGIFVLLYFVNFTYFAHKYAVGYEIPELNTEKRVVAENTPVPIEKSLSDDAIIERKNHIIDIASDKVYDYLQDNTNLNSRNTLLLNDINVKKLQEIDLFQYSTFIQLKRLNHLRGINKLLAIVNEKLPDDGVFVCCYKSKSTTKQQIFHKKNRFIGSLVYFAHFLYHRMMPKFFLTRRLYYDLTGGKKRILSKTEVLGRLSYCGFEPVKQIKIDTNNYIIARRVRQSEPLKLKQYGALIKLRRTGKNGRMFNVYKFRTMHPYAEYIQGYIHKTSSLAEGGKFHRDIRVTTLGRIMRKYWIDEFPMFLNLLKGDMKLIGVRPLSKHYFGLYTKELQEKRVKFKPGLLPPFYADMPKTLDEIQASEMKYLTECDTKGTFRTDFKYFFLILNNILLKKARSA